MTKKQKVLEQLKKEDQEYEAWLRGETEEPPAWLERPIGNPEKVGILCEIAEERVREGVIFNDKNEIVRSYPGTMINQGTDKRCRYQRKFARSIREQGWMVD